MYVSLLDPIDMNYVAAMRDTNGDDRMEFIKYFGELDSPRKGVGLAPGTKSAFLTENFDSISI